MNNRLYESCLPEKASTALFYFLALHLLNNQDKNSLQLTMLGEKMLDSDSLIVHHNPTKVPSSHEVKVDALDQIAGKVGCTPLNRIVRIPIPNRNRIYVKEEWLNPGGSHYDRVYVNLFRSLEQSGRIVRRSTRLIEVSSGSASASFAWLASELEYPCTVILPGGLPRARIDATRKWGADIELSPAGEYVAGATKKLVEILKLDRDAVGRNGNRLICVNHAEDFHSIWAMQTAGREVRMTTAGDEIDYFVGACGNGASLLGIGSEFKSFGTTKVIACDPEETPVAWSRKQGRWLSMPVSSKGQPRHNVFGAGVWGVRFPFLESNLFDQIVDEVVVVSRRDRDYARELLHSVEKKYVGNSSAMALAAIMKLCKQVHGKTFLMVFYDSYSRYN